MSDFDKAVVAAMLKAKDIGVKMLASDCEAILQAAKQSVNAVAVGYAIPENISALGTVGNMFTVLNHKKEGNYTQPIYTHAPDSAARIAEQDAEIARLTKELEEARKDAEAVAWYRETAGGIAICYVQNEPPKDADGPWHPLYTSARKTWIPMNEQRPIEEHGNKVLGFSDGYIFECEYEYSDGEGHWCNITGETMTHWMPRPPEPDASLNIKGGAE